ncbi:MAG: hypothetical protein L6R42_001926 [Xanthoria sp. 1 TBL-2021]|nr:MAG: hypothetical protein L6R42_001926 [Xanthoria sp. 1 TBL-2021]
MCPSSGSESVLDQDKQRGQSSSVNKVSDPREGEGDELEEARAKRAAKEKTSSGKAKRGRKRKSPAPEAGVAEPVVQMSEALEPWRAPVARMY